MSETDAMKIAVFGCTGMLGRRLMEELASAGFQPVGVPEEKVDIRDWPAVEAAVAEIRPAGVINAAAYTDVDGCETNPKLAFDVNAVGAGYIARAAADACAAHVFVSTDYVFDGWRNVPYTENDRPNPQGVYATSKWEGEKLVASEGGRWFIIRTSWLFGPDGKNFVDTILRLSAERETLSVVCDQIGRPTYTAHLAGGISRILRIYLQRGLGEPGVYHLAGDGLCSWHELATKIIEIKPGKVTEVKKVMTEEYAAGAGRPVAPRPPYSVLNNEKVKKRFGVALPHWEDALADYLSTK
jgi:dTDP-4-dehydrorhamnose reductase